MTRLLRLAFVMLGIISIGVTIGLLLEQEWVFSLIPWKLSRLSSIFVASILLASGMPVLWIGLSGEMAAAASGSLDLTLMYGGIAAYTAQLYRADTSRDAVLRFSIACGLYALISLGLFLWTRRIPFHKTYPTPRSVQFSFALFALILILVGGALVTKEPNIFPWLLKPELSVLYGWIFLGAAVYFLYLFTNRKWGNAQGQLIGFLAYDLVLIGPYLNHFRHVPSHLLDSLILYLAVLIYSGALAIYYLFLHPDTRFKRGFS